jgi:hypothetical protein
VTPQGLTLIGKRSLKKKGALLQKTLQQRAGRLRGEGTFLEIRVTPPQPLLQVSLDLDQEGSDSFFLLQGQFQFGNLTIKNEGGAAAANLDVKLSEPFLIIEMSNDGSGDASSESQPEFMRPITPSGTAFELPRDIVLLPGQSRSFRVCVRLENSGRQIMSLFLNYSREGTEEMRGSFASFQFYVFSSLVISARTAPRSTDPMKRVLILDLKSYLEPDELLSSKANTEDPKISHRENFYSLEGVHDELLEECSIRIENVFVVGTLREDDKIKVTLAENTIRSKEKLSLIFPSVLTTVDTEDKSTRLHPNVWHAVASRKAPKSALPQSQYNYISTPELGSINEKFSCLQVLCRKYHQEIQIARSVKMQEASAAEETGPRTISQVRRDRQKDSLEKESTDDVEVLSKSWTPKTLEDIAKFETLSAIHSVSDIFSSSKPSSDRISLGGTCVVVSWVARWGGITRRGMQMLHDIPALSSIPSTISSRASAITPSDGSSLRTPGMNNNTNVIANIEKLLSVTAKFPKKVVLPPNSRSCKVSVQLSIMSAYSRPLRVTVETIEKRPTIKSSEDYSVSSSPTGTLSTKSNQSARGILWIGKSKYSNISVNSFSAVDLQYTVALSKYGIIDLKRFKVTFEIEGLSGETLSIVKDIQGNCLIEVVDAEVSSISATSLLQA